jgi:hypothetical protein
VNTINLSIIVYHAILKYKNHSRKAVAGCDRQREMQGKSGWYILCGVPSSNLLCPQVMLKEGRRKGDAQISSFAENSTNPVWEDGDAEFDL